MLHRLDIPGRDNGLVRSENAAHSWTGPLRSRLIYTPRTILRRVTEYIGLTLNSFPMPRSSTMMSFFTQKDIRVSSFSSVSNLKSFSSKIRTRSKPSTIMGGVSHRFLHSGQPGPKYLRKSPILWHIG